MNQERWGPPPVQFVLPAYKCFCWELAIALAFGDQIGASFNHTLQCSGLDDGATVRFCTKQRRD